LASEEESTMSDDKHTEVWETIQSDDKKEAPFGADQDHPGADGLSDANDSPGTAGYADREAESEMPRVPTVDDTQEDSHPHGGESGPGGERDSNS